MRVNPLRGDREAVAGAAARGRGGGAPARRRLAAARRRRRSSIAGRTGEAVPAAVAAGELTPQSRGSAAVVEVLDPQAGRARARPLRRPRDQDRPDRRADGRPRRGDLGRARPRPRRRSRRPGEPPRPAQRHRDRGRRDRGGHGPGLRPGPARRALLGPRRPRLAPGRPLAQVAEDDRAAGRDPGRGCCARRRGRCAPAAPSSTRPARSPAARTRSGSRPCCAPPRPGEVPPLRARRPRRPRPGLASPAEPRCLQLRPDRDRTTGFFIARLTAADPTRHD